MALPKLKKISQLPSAVTIAGDDFWIIDQNNVTKKATIAQLLQKVSTSVGNVELRKTDTYIQWRHVGDTEWQNLIAIADISGGGNSFTVDDTTVNIRINNEYIQWQFQGGSWYNLITLTEIRLQTIPEMSVFSGDGETLEFGPVPGLASSNPNRCQVVVGGVAQQPTVSYTISLAAGGKLIFDQAPYLGLPISIQPL